MSENKKKQRQSGGGWYKPAEKAVSKKLSDCVLNNWKDLRNALEVGAAEQAYVTSSESTAEEEITINLKIINPRALAEEKLTDANVRKFMGFELAELATKRQVAMERAQARAAVVEQNAPPEEVKENDAEEGGADDDAAKANEEVDIDSLYERRIDIKHSYETAEIDCFKAKLVMPLDSLGLFTGVFIDSLSVSDGGVTKFGFYGTDLDKRIQQEFISAIRSISFKNFCKK